MEFGILATIGGILIAALASAFLLYSVEPEGYTEEQIRSRKTIATALAVFVFIISSLSSFFRIMLWIVSG